MEMWTSSLILFIGLLVIVKVNSIARSRRRCRDWMLVGGHFHYAKDRSSFKTYRPIRRLAMGLRVLGIGTVELEVRRSPDRPSADTYKLVLENVLHLPDVICNGFNHRIVSDPQMLIIQDGGIARGLNINGEPIWYGNEFCNLWRLVLAGKPHGESALKDNAQIRLLSLHLSEEGRNLLLA
jgi:hypothetical protein